MTLSLPQASSPPHPFPMAASTFGLRPTCEHVMQMQKRAPQQSMSLYQEDEDGSQATGVYSKTAKTASGLEVV